ncbi:hypothetical protein [Microbacterium sp. 179-I 3D3 NHS]|uniref:hypothetical protein n=1 Tax=Microbacterium sp. 179-I 3D3 NHS TaxID=3142382 RepID=UPI0039A126AD
MATQDRNTTGWFTAAEVAEAMQLSEQDFLRAFIDGPDDELEYWSGEPQIHWRDLLAWVEKHYYETSEVGPDNPMVKWHIDRGGDPETIIENRKREQAFDGARDLLEELLGLDAWTDGLNGRVATNWNMETLDYEVESLPDGM